MRCKWWEVINVKLFTFSGHCFYMQETSSRPEIHVSITIQYTIFLHHNSAKHSRNKWKKSHVLLIKLMVHYKVPTRSLCAVLTKCAPRNNVINSVVCVTISVQTPTITVTWSKQQSSCFITYTNLALLTIPLPFHLFILATERLFLETGRYLSLSAW
jgi:hypothetical protein